MEIFRHWMAELVAGGTLGVWILGQSFPSGGDVNIEVLKQLGPASVGIAALYLSLKFVGKETEANRKSLDRLTSAIEQGMLNCPARKKAEGG